MNQSKEFQGKSLDDAIQEACVYFGVAREKLEIEILNDAKGGIFGLMGMKKASIRATRAQTAEVLENLLEAEAAAAPDRTAKADTDADGAKNGKGRGTAKADAKKRQERRQENEDGISQNGQPPRHGQSSQPSQPAQSGGQRQAAPAREGKDSRRCSPAKDASQPENREKAGKEAAARAAAKPAPPQASAAVPRSGAARAEAHAFAETSGNDEGPRESLPEFDMEKGDLELLKKCVSEVVLRLIRPIVGDVACEVEISGKRARAVVDCGEAASLLVGRDGQTLASVQYLAGRIVAKRLGASVRLQIDAGRFRERQDDRLRELALSLADKARKSGRAQSTRPLTAYQRRIIHLALEGEPLVHTRSKGEGPQRRVLILPGKDRDARPEELPEPTEPGAAPTAPESAPGDARQPREFDQS